MKRGVKVEERFVELRIFDMLKMRGSPGGRRRRASTRLPTIGHLATKKSELTQDSVAMLPRVLPLAALREGVNLKI